MNAIRLLAFYERIADAPDAIARLRGLIFDLAVRGKLVIQIPTDEPISELFRQFALEKGRLVKSGEIRTPKPTTAIRPDEVPPITLPRNWGWLRLCDIGKLSGGMTPSMNRADFWGGDIVWLSPKDIKSDVVANSELKITTKGLSETRLELYPPKSLFMVARSGILKRVFPVSISQVPAAANQDMKVLVPFLNGLERYLQVVFRGLNRYILENLVKTGTTVQSLKYDEFERQPFPIPPLAEQHRIVTKVDELMVMCNRLEAARLERETRRDRLTTASLARLNTPDPETFQNDARFALEALSALTARPDQVRQFRQTILNLAVRGIFSMDGAWRSTPTRVGDVASLQNGYAFKSEWFSKSGTRLVRNANVGHGSLEWADEVRLPDSKVHDYERFRLAEGDIVLTLDRPFIATGTKVARVAARDLPALLLQRVGRFVLSESLHPDYLLAWINSPHFSEQINPGRSNGVPHISSKQVEAAVMFLPPLTEQRHIVDKVNELMQLCDRIEAKLVIGDVIRSRLIDALLAEVLAPSESSKIEAVA
jgi:type I restriction enzyme S subunit